MQYRVNHFDKLQFDRPKSPYIITSDLKEGYSSGRSSLLCLKCVSSGEEVYQFHGIRARLTRNLATLTPSDEDINVTIPSGARGVCVYFPVDDLERALGESLAEDLEGDKPTSIDLFGMRMPMGRDLLPISINDDLPSDWYDEFCTD